MTDEEEERRRFQELLWRKVPCPRYFPDCQCGGDYTKCHPSLMNCSMTPMLMAMKKYTNTCVQAGMDALLESERTASAIRQFVDDDSGISSASDTSYSSYDAPSSSSLLASSLSFDELFSQCGPAFTAANVELTANMAALDISSESSHRRKEEATSGGHNVGKSAVAEGPAALITAEPTSSTADRQRQKHSSIEGELNADEQTKLVRHLRAALGQTDVACLSSHDRRIVDRLKFAIYHPGGIWRDALTRYKRRICSRKDRKLPNGRLQNVNWIVLSRLSLNEIRARAEISRKVSRNLICPLEVYYSLVMGDVLWPLEERQPTQHDFVYHPEEIATALGTASSPVSTITVSNDFQELVKRRAVTTAVFAGRAFKRFTKADNPVYNPPRLPDLGIYEAFGGPAAMKAAIDGDMQPILDAVRHHSPVISDIMRIDNARPESFGQLMRYWRDYLDDQAARRIHKHTTKFSVDDIPEEPIPGGKA